MKRNLLVKLMACAFIGFVPLFSFAATATTTSDYFEVDTTVKLIPESANWSEGSITLWFTDGGVSGSEDNYVVYFRDAIAQSEEGWEEIPYSESERMWHRAADGKLTFTDPKFATRLDGGIAPVEYLILDNNSVVDGQAKVYASCITRTKYGIFVGVGKYDNADARGLEEDAKCKLYAEKIAELAKEKGRLAESNVRTLTDGGAKSRDLENAFEYIYAKAIPGDVCLLYFFTHGGGGFQEDGSTTGLALHDVTYSNAKLKQQIARISGKGMAGDQQKGVAVVGFVHACESASIGSTLNDLSSLNNTAWVTSSYGLTYGEYFSLALLDYGWEDGWAGDSGQPLTCKNLAEYTKKLTDAVFAGVYLRSCITKKDGTSEHVFLGTPEVCINDMYGILGNITIGKCGSRPATTVPNKVRVEASQGMSPSQINVKLSNLPSNGKLLYLRKCDNDPTYDFDTWNPGEFWSRNGEATIYDTKVAASSKINPFSYQVRVINGAGVSVSDVSDATKGWRSSVMVTFDANGGEFFSDGATSRTIVSALGSRTVDFSNLENPISPIGSNLGFKDWQVRLNGNETLTDYSLYVPGMADVEYTFYARWVQVCDVVFMNNGRVCKSYLEVEVGKKLSEIGYPLVLSEISNTEFGGWWTQPDGKGIRVDNDPNAVANAGDNRYYAYWKPKTYIASGSTDTPISFSQTYTFTSYLQLPSDDGVTGTMTVKTQKAKDDVASATVTIQSADGKKQTIKGTISVADGTGQGALAGLTFTANGVTGTLNGYSVDGAMDASKSKDAATVAVLNTFKGKAYGMALEPKEVTGENAAMVNGIAGFSVVFASKGKAKVTGALPDGTKVSASSRLIVGSEWCCLPIVYSKAGNSLAFMLWFDRAGNFDSVSGLTTWKGKGFEVTWNDDVAASKVGNLSGTSYFHLEESPIEINGAEIIRELLPADVSVSPAGAKWNIAKGKVVKLDRSGNLSYDVNPSGLKLTFTAKTGMFKGSFAIYTINNGKLRKNTVIVSGVVVDGVGYGTASIKKVGCWPIVINGEAAKAADFKARITGVAVVDELSYDETFASVTFVPPETALEVPYGKMAVFRTEYDFPTGYSTYVWVRESGPAAENVGSSGSYFNRGTGVAYNFIMFREGGETCTLKSVRLEIMPQPEVAGTDGSWDIGTTAVNLTFKAIDDVGMTELDRLKSQFKVSVTGVAVVDDSVSYYDDADVAAVTFLSPQTSLDVPYGATVLIRMSYDFPPGYAAQLWTCAAKWSAAPGGSSYSNPSLQHVGKGTAYGFIGLEGHSASCTLEAIRVDAGAYLTDDGERTEWGLCTTPVNITFSR